MKQVYFHGYSMDVPTQSLCFNTMFQHNHYLGPSCHFPFLGSFSEVLEISTCFVIKRKKTIKKTC